MQCASSAWGLPLAFTSRPPARQEQRFRHPVHRLVYSQHYQTRYSRDGGMPADSTCQQLPGIREQGPASDHNRNSCTESRNHNTAPTCLQYNNKISHEQVYCNTSTLREIKVTYFNVANGVDNNRCHVLWRALIT